MKQHQGSVADSPKSGKAPGKTGMAARVPHQQLKGLASPSDGGRLQKAAGDVKEILKNSRHS